MRMEKDVRIGCCLLAMALLGALMVRTSFAADADSITHDGNKAAGPSTESGSPQPPPGADAASSSGAKNADDIDTRISVQPRRAGAKPDKAGESKTKLSVPL